MNDFLFYILESTISISCFYIVFRVMMSKEACFSVNRWLLLITIVGSSLIPLINFPGLHNSVHVELIPHSFSNQIYTENIVVAGNSNETKNLESPVQIEKANTFSLVKLLTFIYLLGVFAALLILIKNITAILLLLRKATITKMDGFRVFISNEDISSFVFAHTIIISKGDYHANGSTILSHEKAHVQLKHFYDLILLELIKVFHWFNPAIYGVVRRVKEIHEFQADSYTLNAGVEASHYQLLLIKKCVGPNRFALINSFNHCQIKKRIIMMNKQKSSKVWRLKVATFIPVLALLLFSFSKKESTIKEVANGSENKNNQLNSVLDASMNHQSQSDENVIHIKKEGNFIGGKKCSLEEIVQVGKKWNEASNDWILLQIDDAISANRVDEVREALHDAEVYFITQSVTNSDETVYFAGDVSAMAKFKDGKLDNWMNGELAEILGDKYNSVNYRIGYFYIVDKTGKAREGRVIKPCEYPEINNAYEKVLSQIPDWYPAKRGGKPVSVYYRVYCSQKVTEQ